MADPSDSALVQGSKQQRQDAISHADSINRTKLRVSDSLSSHRRAYRIALAANIAYGKIFGWAHMLPNVYIAGFAKCGTTSLYTYLAKHPQVRPPFTKEVHYFDHDKRYQRGLNWYRSNFPLSIHKKICEKREGKKFVSIDATPRYINHPHTISRIKRVAGDAKFIVLVRNPIERAYSHYNMNVHGATQIPEDLSFDEAIKQESQRIKGEYERMERDELYYSAEYFGYAYAERGLYARWLKGWLAEFPDRVLVLDSDSLTGDTQATFDKVTDFVGIDRHKLADTQRRNVGSYARDDISEATRKRLAEYYREPNAELYSLLGQDLEWS